MVFEAVTCICNSPRKFLALNDIQSFDFTGIVEETAEETQKLLGTSLSYLGVGCTCTFMLKQSLKCLLCHIHVVSCHLSQLTRRIKL
jgi:hypothetical protein